MTKSTFSVNVRDLDDGPKELNGSLTQEWVAEMLKDTEVTPHGEQDGTLELVLTKTGQDVLVQGHLALNVSVPCSRTLDPAVYELRPDIFLMLAPSGNDPTSIQGRRPGRSARKNREKENKKSGKKSEGWEADPELSEAEAATDTYSGDQVVLDHFIREFILLEVPMVPLREDLRGASFEANPPLPSDRDPADASSEEMASAKSAEKPLDPRLSPLAELKARLENKE